ncbi:aldo/keto reductase [Sphingobium sp. Sx8-8]|uniref:aldo/keto reductase n=1 Tax=Sphingobium sp. Sx8-8 TaxID=2933617 RepID=UPI001F584474|nr:aldo/keto reductase [Sphingobium sp. Sx8-8]
MTGIRTLTDDVVGTITIGDLTVRRLGFGAMRIWPGVSGAGPRDAHGRPDRGLAHALCRRVVERGVTFIDTADIYGFGGSEEILGEALHPYAPDLVITTKAGYEPRALNPGETVLPSNGRPDHIRRQCEQSLRKLKLEAIPLYQCHVPDPDVPYADTIGAFADLQREGKVRHVGVSNVTLDQLRIAQSVCSIVSVQNRYNLGVRTSDDLLRVCEAEGIAFLPFRPMMDETQAIGLLLRELAAAHDALPQQIVLAWMLARSPVLLPIPGTSDSRHLDLNVDAAWIRLSDAEIASISRAVARDAGS